MNFEIITNKQDVHFKEDRLITLVGLGNDLRGEDAFGFDVVDAIQKLELEMIHCIKVYALRPELCITLQDAQQIIFVDACFANENHYALAASCLTQSPSKLSHHISIFELIGLLKEIYGYGEDILIFSMLTNSFEAIEDESRYNKSVHACAEMILELKNLK